MEICMEKNLQRLQANADTYSNTRKDRLASLLEKAHSLSIQVSELVAILEECKAIKEQQVEVERQCSLLEERDVTLPDISSLSERVDRLHADLEASIPSPVSDSSSISSPSPQSSCDKTHPSSGTGTSPLSSSSCATPRSPPPLPTSPPKFSSFKGKQTPSPTPSQHEVFPRSSVSSQSILSPLPIAPSIPPPPHHHHPLFPESQPRVQKYGGLEDEDENEDEDNGITMVKPSQMKEKSALLERLDAANRNAARYYSFSKSNNGGDEEETVDDHSLTDNSEDMPNLHKQFMPPQRPKL